jgi:hypothetical protein
LKGMNEKAVIDTILSAISHGKMLVILKDTLGRSCDSSYHFIPVDALKGKWITPRVLVPSNAKLYSL